MGRARIATVVACWTVTCVCACGSSIRHLPWKADLTVKHRAAAPADCEQAMAALEKVYLSRTLGMSRVNPVYDSDREGKKNNRGGYVGDITFYDETLYRAVEVALETCPAGFPITEKLEEQLAPGFYRPLTALVATYELFPLLYSQREQFRLKETIALFPPYLPPNVEAPQGAVAEARKQLAATRDECTRIVIVENVETIKAGAGDLATFSGGKPGLFAPAEYSYQMETSDSSKAYEPVYFRPGSPLAAVGDPSQDTIGVSDSALLRVETYRMQVAVYRPFLLCFPPDAVKPDTEWVRLVATYTVKPDKKEKSVFWKERPGEKEAKPEQWSNEGIWRLR